MFKKAVLIIHGFTGSTYEMEYLQNYISLNSNIDVYTFTLPGHERAVIGGVKYEDWINYSNDMLCKLKSKYKSIYLIGHSMGGVIATHLAKEHSEIKKLVLLAPAFKYINLKQIKDDISIKIKDKKKYELEYKDEAYKGILYKIYSTPLKMALEFTKLVNEYYECPKYINCSTLIIHGKRDEIVPLASSEYVYNSILHNKKYLKVIENARHILTLGTEKEVVSEYVCKYLIGGLKWEIMKD